jgi:hypothetical protein
VNIGCYKLNWGKICSDQTIKIEYVFKNRNNLWDTLIKKVGVK